MSVNPTIGRIVHYVSRTGTYEVPAIINCTWGTIYRPGVDGGFVPDLTTTEHVHLTVMTPGKPGKRVSATDFVVPSKFPISENVAGTYQEWDVPHDENRLPGTWHWPEREEA